MEPHTLRFKVALDPTYTEYDACGQHATTASCATLAFDVRAPSMDGYTTPWLRSATNAGLRRTCATTVYADDSGYS